MEKDLKEVGEHYKSSYYNEEISNRIKEKVQLGVMRKRVSFARKLAYGTSAAVVAAGMFIGLAFYSPAVADVAAKIPYLKMLFESKPFTEELMDTLKEKGYPVMGAGVSYSPKKLVSVNLDGTPEYVESVKPEVEKIVKDILGSRNFDAYKIEVDLAPEPVEFTAEEKKEIEEDGKVSDVVVEVLKSYGYEGFSFGSSSRNKSVSINLPNTENRVEEIVEKLKTSLAEKQLGTFSIEVDTYNAKKREREGRWSEVISTIAEGVFGNKEYKVKGVGYSNKSEEYMIIHLRTTVESTDSDYEKVNQKIEDTIIEFLESAETREIIQSDAYQVIITSKDKKDYVITSKEK